MISPLRCAVIVLVTSLGTPGQVDPFTWVAYPGAMGAPGLVGVFDAAGSSVNTFSQPVGTISVAKTNGGPVWVLSSAALQAYDAAGTVGAPVPVTGASAVVTSSTGEAWTFVPGNLFVPGLLHRRDAMGAIVQSFIPPLASILGMQADPFGDVWLVDAVTNQVFKYTPNFSAFTYLFGTVGDVALDWELDPQGRAWFLTSGTPGQVGLVRLSNTGATTLSTTFATEMPTALKIDGCGRVRLLRTMANQQQEIVTLDDAGAVIGMLPLPSIAPATRDLIGFDVRGGALLRNGTAVEVFDETGAVVATMVAPQGTPALRAGDLTGLRLLSVVDRGGDGDLDGVPNGDEFQVGADPTSVTSPVQLTVAPAPAIGASFGISLSAPLRAGFPYLIGGSGATTGIPVGPSPACPQVPLAADPLLSFWFDPTNPFVTNATGVLDINGDGTATVSLPPDPGLSGASFFAAGVTVNPLTTQIAVITAPRLISIP